MEKLRELRSYSDDRGNVIEYSGTLSESAKINVKFSGERNRLVVAPHAKIVDLDVEFAGDDATFAIGDTTEPRTGLRFMVKLGHSCTVSIGSNVGAETRCFIRVSEGQVVTIGDDCMLAAGVAIRADDTHAIYDVQTGKRSNPAGSVDVGEHVWLGKDVIVLGGAMIGEGSVVGIRSVVTRKLPNNCVAAGVPARVVKRHVAWERPVLTDRTPGIEGVPDGHEKTEKYWNMTSDDSEPEN